ncbi:MAG: phosphate ABC transporter permease subunit PstC [Commensalibacter sp.]
MTNVRKNIDINRKASSSSWFNGLVWISSFLILFIFIGLILKLLWGSQQAFATFGIEFLTRAIWNPVTQQYGAVSAVLGTLVTSLIGIVIAIPLAFGSAYALSEIIPIRISRIVTPIIQLLAAVPSIIFGMWGFFFIVPLMARYVQPFLKHNFGHIPILSALFSGPPFGVGLFTGGLILAVMITPFIAAVMQNAFQNTPALLKESAYSLGATKWEIMRYVTLAWSKKAVLGGIILGWGRALGETMAITFVIGNANKIGWSLFAPSNTISSLIALEFPESATGSLKMSSLMGLGVILMVISFLALFCSRYLLRQSERKLRGN